MDDLGHLNLRQGWLCGRRRFGARMPRGGIQHDGCNASETQEGEEGAFVEEAVEWHVQTPVREKLDLQPKHIDPTAVCYRSVTFEVR